MSAASGRACSGREEAAVGRHRIAWEEGAAAWTEAARFFARVIGADPAYISHGEIQTGLSPDGKTWAPDLEARFLAEATSDQTGRSLAVARDTSNAVIAAAAVSWSFETADAPFAVLQDLAVEPSLRSKGLGAELVEFVEREALARKAAWLFLESGKSNRRAHTFFARTGFEEVSHVFAKRLAK
jgi:GNAT superfamily N-acetyltransferase